MEPDLTPLVTTAHERPVDKLTNNPHTTRHSSKPVQLPDPVDHQVRPTSRSAMSTDHVDATITAICDQLDRHDWNATRRAILAARRRDLTGSVTPDGYPHGTLGDGGSRATTSDTSTERAGIALADEPPRHDEHHELANGVIADLLDLERTKQRLVRKLQRIAQIADKPAETLVAPTCCEPNCEDPAERGRRGRCDPCRKWVQRWEEAHPGEQAPFVPAGVIDQRIAARTNRKVHISGPLASFQ